MRKELDVFRARFQALRAQLSEVIVGYEREMEDLITALVVGGHVLIEGVPGLGKTLLVRTLASALELQFSRIQFTPDLMPADITGTHVVHEENGQRVFRFREGPVFANVVLADEINRATPKTQSALLEAMQESKVTSGGEAHELPPPFMVVATQNPIEMRGTYPLPEAQLDRFLLKLVFGRPGEKEMVEILDRTTGASAPSASPVAGAEDLLGMRRTALDVPAGAAVKEHAARLVLLTHPDSSCAPEEVKRFVRYGSSVRGAQAVVMCAKVRAILAGRPNAGIADARASALAALRHRLVLNFEAESSGVTPDGIVEAALRACGEG